jgi:hypothetical protein
MEKPSIGVTWGAGPVYPGQGNWGVRVTALVSETCNGEKCGVFILNCHKSGLKTVDSIPEMYFYT